MAQQQPSDFVAPTSALITLLAAYNIDLLISNIKLSLLIILSSSLLLLLFRLFFIKKPVSADHADLTPSIASNTTKTKKNAPRQTPPLVASDTQSQAMDFRQAKNDTPEKATEPEKPTEWSLQLLQDMDWKHFDNLCTDYYESMGYITKTFQAGENKDVDIFLYKNTSPNKIFGIIKCKKWQKPVGINPVKALSTIQSNQKIPLAVYFSVTGFSKTAISFCDNKHLKLISGEELIRQIKNRPLDIQHNLLQAAVRGDYTIPSCTKCSAKMVFQTNNKSNKQVWRCQHYSTCKTTIYLSHPIINS